MLVIGVLLGCFVGIWFWVLGLYDFGVACLGLTVRQFTLVLVWWLVVWVAS